MTILWHPAEHSIVCLSSDRTATVWDLESRQAQSRFAVHTMPTGGAFNPNGRWLVTNDAGEGSRIWETGTWSVKLLRKWSAHAAFSSDSRIVALPLPGDKTQIELVDPETGLQNCDPDGAIWTRGLNGLLLSRWRPLHCPRFGFASRLGPDGDTWAVEVHGPRLECRRNPQCQYALDAKAAPFGMASSMCRLSLWLTSQEDRKTQADVEELGDALAVFFGQKIQGDGRHVLQATFPVSANGGNYLLEVGGDALAFSMGIATAAATNRLTVNDIRLELIP